MPASVHLAEARVLPKLPALLAVTSRARKKGKRKKAARFLVLAKRLRLITPFAEWPEGKMRAIFAPQENCEDVELRLSLDGGEDITCASTIREQLYLRDVRVSGETVPQENILRNNKARRWARVWARGQKTSVMKWRLITRFPSNWHAHGVFDLLRRKRLTGGESKNVRKLNHFPFRFCRLITPIMPRVSCMRPPLAALKMKLPLRFGTVSAETAG